MTDRHESVDKSPDGDKHRSGPVGPGPSPSTQSRGRSAAEGVPQGPAQRRAPTRPATGGAIGGPDVAAGVGAVPGAAPTPAIIIDTQPYLSFAVAVLELHRVRTYDVLTPPREQCGCGRLRGECPIRGLADRLGLPP